ncbi:MAG: PA2817 family protein [Oleibacter sp.]|nr:PA2817 family protein [Thalassolituus sp.]
MSDRRTYHLDLLRETQHRLINAQKLEPSAIEDSILHQFDELITQLEQQDTAAYDTGQHLFSHIALHQPQLMPALDRALFWLFGGECLHCLTDEEIERFQHLDDMAAEAENEGKTYDYRAAGRSLH